MLHLFSLVLKRADDLKSRCFSASQVHKILYLIGMGLVGEQRLKEADPETQFQYSERAEKAELLQSMETLTGSYRIESHKELLAWTIKMFKKAQGLEEKMEVSEETEEDDEEARKKRAKAAAERRKKIMAQMAKQQSNFMVENSQLFDDTPSGLRDRLVSTTEWEEKETREDTSYPLCLGPNRSQAAITKTNFVCILCQEEEHLTADCSTLVMAAYVQKSTVMSKVRGQAPAPVSSSTFPFLSSNLPAAANTSDDAVDVSDATISDTNTPAMEVAEENRDLVEMVVDNSISSDMITDIIEDMSETVDTAPEAEEAPARASPVTGSVVLLLLHRAVLGTLLLLGHIPLGLGLAQGGGQGEVCQPREAAGQHRHQGRGHHRLLAVAGGALYQPQVPAGAESRARVPAAQRRRGRGAGARAAAAEPRQQPEPVLHLPPRPGGGGAQPEAPGRRQLLPAVPGG